MGRAPARSRGSGHRGRERPASVHASDACHRRHREGRSSCAASAPRSHRAHGQRPRGAGQASSAGGRESRRRRGGAPRDAARRAGERGSPAGAAELLELARGLTPSDDGEDWARRTLDAAAAHAEGGEEWRGQQLAREVVERTGPGASARVRWGSSDSGCRTSSWGVKRLSRPAAISLCKPGSSTCGRTRFTCGASSSRRSTDARSGGHRGSRGRSRDPGSGSDHPRRSRGDDVRRRPARTRAGSDRSRGGSGKISTLSSPQTYLGRWYMRRDELSAGRVRWSVRESAPSK